MRNINNQFLHYFLYFIFFGLLVFCSLLVSGKIIFETDLGIAKVFINQRVLTGIEMGKFIPSTGNNYTFIIKEESQNNVSDWVSFLGILTTFLAAFFIYSSWKIDNDLRNISDTKESIKKIEETAVDDLQYSNQLKYAIHYMMSKQYDKAIDALTVLRSESFTLKNDGNLNSCYYFLAICWYEKGILSLDLSDISKALQYIDEAIEDDNHPLKIEITDKFNELHTA